MANINSLIISIFICACAFVVVHGDDYSWIPETVPTPSEQCTKIGEFHPTSSGMCEMENGKESICSGLVCSVERNLRFFAARQRRAADGTICGSSNVCRAGACVEVPPKKLPKEEGSKVVKRCRTVFL